MIPLSKYVRIKDKYCVAYFGTCDEYVDQLLAARPHIAKELPGIQVYIACRDEVFAKHKNQEGMLSFSQLKVEKSNFPYVRELKDRPGNIVEDFLKESNIFVPHPRRTVKI